MDHDELELEDEEADLFLGDEDDEKKLDEEDPLSMGFHEIDPFESREPESDF